MTGAPSRVRDARDADHVAPRSRPSASRSSLRGQGELDLDVPAVRDHGGAGLVEQVEEAEQDVRRRVLDHERAAALPAHHQPLGRQIADGLAGRALADAELGGDLELVGDELAWLPLARADALDQALAHLGVERSAAVVVGQAHQVAPLPKVRDWIAGRILYKNRMAAR